MKHKSLVFKILQLFIAFAILSYGCIEFDNDDDDDDDDDILIPMSWEGVDHYYGFRNHFLSLTELLGPEGATISKLIPGKYVAKGRFDVTGSEYSKHITVGFVSPYPSDSASTFTVLENQLKGEFETYCIIDFLPSDETRIIIQLISDHTLIDEIIPYDEQRPSDDIDPVLEMLGPVALGNGVPEAAEYNQSASSTHKLGILSWEGRPYATWNDSLPSEWFPNDISEAQLVAILRDGTEPEQQCDYSDGFVLKRYSRLLNVTLREAQTGNIVDETTLWGYPPGACPFSIEHSTTQWQKSVYGPSVQYLRLENWLRTYVIP